MRLTSLLVVLAFVWGCSKEKVEPAKVLASYDWIGSPDSIGQIVVLKNHEYGLVDTFANVIASPVYSYIGPFIQSVRRVQRGWETGSSYWTPLNQSKEGAIDSAGKVIVPVKYDAVDGFWRLDDYTLVALEGKVGVYRIDGKLIAGPVYDAVGYSNSGSTSWMYAGDISWKDAQPSKKKKRGRRANQQNEEAGPPPLFDEYGLIQILNERHFGWLDSSGKEVVSPKYDYLGAPNTHQDSTVWYRKDGKWGLVSLSGKELTPPIYDDHTSWTNGHAMVQQGRNYGIVNTRGKETQPVVYSSIRMMDASYCLIQKAETRYLVGLAAISSDRVYIAPMYRQIYSNHSGDRFIAQSDENFMYGVINPNNKILLPFVYNEVDWLNDGSFTYYRVNTNGLWGYLTNSFKPIGQPVWKAVGQFSNGLAAVTNDNSIYLMNYSGKLKEYGQRR